eukprot:1996555-Amphidinium_carterae.2
MVPSLLTRLQQKPLPHDYSKTNNKVTTHDHSEKRGSLKLLVISKLAHVRVCDKLQIPVYEADPRTGEDREMSALVGAQIHPGTSSRNAHHKGLCRLARSTRVGSITHTYNGFKHGVYTSKARVGEEPHSLRTDTCQHGLRIACWACVVQVSPDERPGALSALAIDKQKQQTVHALRTSPVQNCNLGGVLWLALSRYMW